MNGSDRRRPRIRPAVSHRYDGSTYYEFIEARTREVEQPSGSQTGSGTLQPDGGQTPQGSSKRTLRLGAALLTLLVGAGGFFGLRALGPSDGVEATDAAPMESASTTHGDATRELAQLSDESRGYVSTHLDGKWVVQLSAKQDGLTAAGKTWDDQTILEEYRQLESSYGDTLLLRSSEWSTFRMGGYWVTIQQDAYDTPEAALDQCRTLKRDRDSCFAKFISSTGSPDGSTVLLPE